VPSIEGGAVDVLAEYDWPGNVRELQNVLTRALIVSRGATIERSSLIGSDALADANRNKLVDKEKTTRGAGAGSGGWEVGKPAKSSV
jgi:DNA-binding NtrC family response regulator